MQPRTPDLEQFVRGVDKRIEELKIQFNLFFSGEVNIPPEKERSDIEKKIRNILSSDQKSATINILIQNIASKFALYNNMWLKKLHEIEVGLVEVKKKPIGTVQEHQNNKAKQKDITVSLNSENSFEQFFEDYCSFSKKKSFKSSDKESIINSLKSKMITASLVDAKINLFLKQGKVKIRIKK